MLAIFLISFSFLHGKCSKCIVETGAGQNIEAVYTDKFAFTEI